MLDQVGFADCQISMKGWNPFLLTCQGAYFTVEKFGILLQRGASVYDRDDYGNTCLHKCLQGIHRRIYVGNVSHARDGLMYLIQRGADVFAENEPGESVSHAAYNIVYTTDEEPHHRAFREDVWDCVLANCGYDIYDFRPHGRGAVYAKSYTRAHFEELWAGCEHLCPYYNDEEDAVYLTDSSGDLENDDEDGGTDHCHEDEAMEEDSVAEEMGDDDASDWSDSEDGGVNLGAGNGIPR